MFAATPLTQKILYRRYQRSNVFIQGTDAEHNHADRDDPLKVRNLHARVPSMTSLASLSRR